MGVDSVLITYTHHLQIGMKLSGISPRVMMYLTARLAMWTPATLPSYILDNVEVFPTPAASINKFEDAEFSLSPNPAKEVLNLKASKAISNIEIYNVMGQKILAKKINAVNNSIDISKLNKGMYLMNVTIDSTTESYRFIKE